MIRPKVRLTPAPSKQRSLVVNIETGINGKMNELQAAFGLLYLKYVDSYIERRKIIALRYRELLENVNGIKIMSEMGNVIYNYSTVVFPVIIKG